MSAALLRWADPEIAAVWFALRDFAPKLAALVHCPVPDRQLYVVLAWADQLALPDPGPALDLDRLREVLPAIRTCFVGAHTYAMKPASPDGGAVLELYDLDGAGRIVGRVLGLNSIVAMSLHGEDGHRLVQDVHADLKETLGRLWEMIASG